MVWLQGVSGDVAAALLHLVIVIAAVLVAQRFLASKRRIL
jgi:hypothetical protein